VSGPLDFGDDRAGEEPPAPRRPEAPPPARPPGVSRYTWFIGVVAFLLVVLVTVNSVGGGGAAEPGGPAGGERLPPFAAPLANAAPRADGN
jgi:hypothetical protein